MWKGEPPLSSFWSHSQILWFRHFRKIGVGSQQCFLGSPGIWRALTNPPRGTCPESSVPALGCQALGRDSQVWPCIQPLHKHMQPTLFKSLLPWSKPLTPLGPGTAQPPAFGFSPLNFGKSSPGASGACTWRNESFSVLSRIEGSVSHWVQIPPRPPF